MNITSSLLLALAAAGGAGAAVRYLLDAFIRSTPLAQRLPAGTLIINALGSFLIGVLAALPMTVFGYLAPTRPWDLSPQGHLVLATGFCGGFTTFSTAIWEVRELLASGRRRAGWSVLLGTAAVSVIAVVLGMAAGRALHQL